MALVLIPLPHRDFDPTEAGVPWRVLCEGGHRVPLTVEDEVRTALAASTDFIRGPMMIRRDSPAHLQIGFTVRDRNYLSARWPGDAHLFAHDFATMLQ